MFTAQFEASRYIDFRLQWMALSVQMAVVLLIYCNSFFRSHRYKFWTLMKIKKATENKAQLGFMKNRTAFGRFD